MDCRGLVVLSVVLVASALPLLPACKGPDPGAITFEERPGGGTTDLPGGGSTSSSSSSSSASSSGAAGGDAFFKTAFAHHPPGQKANDHNDATHTGQTPLQGKNCVVAGCHEGGGTPWTAAGTVYGDTNGAALPVGTKLEIEIQKPDGTVFGTWSPDDDGNFWLDDPPGPIPDGSKVAIRKEGGKSMAMATPLTAANKGGGCNNATGCHGQNTLRIYAP